MGDANRQGAKDLKPFSGTATGIEKWAFRPRPSKITPTWRLTFITFVMLGGKPGPGVT